MQLKQVLEIWFSSQILKRSIKTAIGVGTILAFINHGELIFSWSFTSMLDENGFNLLGPLLCSLLDCYEG